MPRKSSNPAEDIEVRVEIMRFVEDSVPGWVECRLIDAAGREHLFREKIPVVTSADIWAKSPYPQAGSITARIMNRHTRPDGSEVITVTTEKPWGVESMEGRTVFEIRTNQLLPRNRDSS